MKVKKRDGRCVDFDSEKISNAVQKALQASGEQGFDLEGFIARTEELLKERDLWSVEEIQNIVENVLMEQSLFDTARAYIKYRMTRTTTREGKSALMKTIGSYFTEDFSTESANKENANVNASSVAGAFYRIGSEASKSYYELNLWPEEIESAFNKGYIYFHDRDYYGLSINCMQHDLLKMFKKGFSTGNAFITEPRSIQAAMALTCVILQSGQTDLFGGESVPAWDFYMEPYVDVSFKKYFKKNLERLKVSTTAMHDKWLKEFSYQEHTPIFENNDLYKAYSWAKESTEEETYQAAQAMVYNLNSLASRAGQH